MGNTTRDALDRPRAGTPAERARGTGRWDNGNGSLMRILPIALVEPDAPVARLVTHAERASRVTHGHPLSLAACALYTLIVQELLMGAPEPAAALRRARTSLRTHYASTGEASRLEALDELEAWPERNGSGYVGDALWSAWDAFAEGGSYPATIERAVGYGNDTDSTACIAGALAGAHFGVEAIPPAWRSGMRGTAIVAPLLDRLLARARLR
jgi:ADP-ribosylglycohydrolase